MGPTEPPKPFDTACGDEWQQIWEIGVVKPYSKIKKPETLTATGIRFNPSRFGNPASQGICWDKCTKQTITNNLNSF